MQQVMQCSSVLRSSHRRPHNALLDGPFPLQPGQCSLRQQQISANLLLKDSGLAPGAYQGLACKDACLIRAPTPKVGAIVHALQRHTRTLLSVTNRQRVGICTHAHAQHCTAALHSTAGSIAYFHRGLY